MTAWHGQDDFGDTVSLFDQQRLEMAPQEVDAITSMLGIEPGQAVLDLYCGVGRYSPDLSRQGYPVTGVESTAACLKRARQRAAAEDLEVERVQADMREFAQSVALRGYTPGHRLYDGAGLRALLLDAGIDTADLFGNLGDVPYDTDARRFVAAARRATS